MYVFSFAVLKHGRKILCSVLTFWRSLRHGRWYVKNVKLYSRLSMEKDPFSCIFILLAELVLWVLYMIRTNFKSACVIHITPLEKYLLITELFFFFPFNTESGSCQNPKERWECGWLGIDQQTCEARGCCWDTSDPNKPWCYVKPGTSKN